MQGPLSLSQRLSVQSLAAVQSYRTLGFRSVGFSSFSHWQALEFEKPRASPGVANDLPLLETLTANGLAFVGNTGNTDMRGTSFASTPSCSYKTEVMRSGVNWAFAASGKSCGIPKSVQRYTGLQWLSLHTHRGHARKPVVRVAGKVGGQEALVREEDFEFKRIVSESDSITTFYSSDISSSTEDDDEEDEKKTKAAKAYTEDSDSEGDDDGENGKDHKKAKSVKSLQKTENSEIEMMGLGNYDDMTMTKGEIVGRCEDSNSESEDEQKKKLTKKGEVVGNCEDSDSDSEDEKEEKLRKEEKKTMKAELKLKEKLEKETLKAMKKEEKRKKKEAAKLDCEGKKDESEIDSESDKESEQYSMAKTKTPTKLKVDEDVASDSEHEEEDDSVTDFGDDALETDEGDFVITEDEIAAYSSENVIADEIEEEMDDIDEDDDFWDDDEGDVVVGDGGTGGGVVLGGTEWGAKALDLAEQVAAECGEDLSIFAFKVSSDRVIRVRLDKLSDRYGSPTMTDIENFSRKFSVALEESGEAGTLPKDIDVEVSSPGAERVVKVPDDLERFKELPMYVQYLEGETEQDGVLELDSVDLDAGLSVWKIANVKLNREVKGRGRPLNSKQKKWRATVPFASLKQVRLYLDV